MATAELAYLDTSAFVKLTRAEPETEALTAALEGVTRLVASEVLEIEALRATRRADGDSTSTRTQLAAVRLISLSGDIRGLASELNPPSVRSLDAIHLATALSLGERLDGGLYTYDKRMARAAREVGLDVHAPA